MHINIAFVKNFFNYRLGAAAFRFLFSFGQMAAHLNKP